jgi:alginate O-acetyltransferase complex protein AlgI
MLFTDPIFLFGFLPISLALYYLTRRFLGGKNAIWFLLIASCLFYSYWSAKYLALLLSQILINYLFARRLRSSHSNLLLWIGISFNLLLLGYFKYRNFFLENVEFLTGLQFHLSALFVPLGISFHTFQQITYLTEVSEAEEDVPSLPQYFLFVLFYPQLIAGPIVLHREMGHQLTDAAENNWTKDFTFGPGFVLFCFGLFKKVCIADNLATFVDVAFRWPLHLQFLEAWSAAVGYALQLFFDFSGYSEMAIGLGLMFGFLLPCNFNIPFAATSMIDYWRRWHITMTRFFRMYCYTPLAMAAKRAVDARHIRGIPAFMLCIGIPTIIAFLASGLWHGAGWTFIVFGLVNGLALLINHAWREAKLPKPPKLLGWFLTIVAALISLVYFRSESLTQAHAILKTMFLPDAIALPLWANSIASRVGLPVTYFEVFQAANFTAHYLCLLLLFAPLSILLPNPALSPMKIRPTPVTALAVAGMLWLSLGLLGEPRTFLYFQF